MQALAWFGKKDVRMVEVPAPTITEPDDVIVKITGTTICGSDLHLYAKSLSRSCLERLTFVFKVP